MDDMYELDQILIVFSSTKLKQFIDKFIYHK